MGSGTRLAAAEAARKLKDEDEAKEALSPRSKLESAKPDKDKALKWQRENAAGTDVTGRSSPPRNPLPRAR